MRRKLAKVAAYIQVDEDPVSGKYRLFWTINQAKLL